jgi:hypothetical protein
LNQDIENIRTNGQRGGESNPLLFVTAKQKAKKGS